MVDSDRRLLERQVAEGDQDALLKLQALNDRTGPNQDYVDYLEQYLRICEKVLGTKNTGRTDSYRDRIHICLADGLRELNSLNQKYKTLVGSKTLKTDLIIRTNLFYPESRVYDRANCPRVRERCARDGINLESSSSDDYIEECDVYPCQHCHGLSDGWVPSNIC